MGKMLNNNNNNNNNNNLDENYDSDSDNSSDIIYVLPPTSLDPPVVGVRQSMNSLDTFSIPEMPLIPIQRQETKPARPYDMPNLVRLSGPRDQAGNYFIFYQLMLNNNL